MAKYSIRFENVDFGEVCGVYGATVCELGKFNVAAGSKADFDQNTMSYDGASSRVFSEIFTALVSALIGEGLNFALIGTYGEHRKYLARCSENTLTVSRNEPDGEKSAVYYLEDGYLNDVDADCFAFFFDSDNASEEELDFDEDFFDEDFF